MTVLTPGNRNAASAARPFWAESVTVMRKLPVLQVGMARWGQAGR